MIKFAFYGRVSTEDQQDPESSRAWQLTRSRALIESRDGVIVAEFFDVDKSRSIPWQRRPEATVLLAELKNPHRGFDAVVIGEPHRAFYGNQYGLTFPIFEHYGVPLWVPEVGGPIDPGNEAHDLVMSVFGGMSKGERNRVKIRVRTAMAAQAQIESRFLGGRPPYGYVIVDAGPHPNPAKAADGKRMHKLDLDTETAPVVRHIFAEFLAGSGIYAIAEGLTRDGIPSPSAHDPGRNTHRSGIAWSKGAIRAILTNPRYTGYQVWNRQRTDEVLLDVENVALGHTARQRWNPADKWVFSEQQAHPLIITKEDFDLAQATLAGRGSRTQHKQHSRPRAYALRGVLLCGLCGRKMSGKWNNEQAYYRCRYPAEYALANRVDHPKNVYLREADVLGHVDDWLAELFDPEAIDATVTQLAAQAGPLEDPAIQARAEAARARIVEYDAQISRYRASIDTGGDPAVIGPWIAETQAKKVAAQAETRIVTGCRRMSRDEIEAVVTAFGDLARIVQNADPQDRADIYAKLRLTLTYQPEEKLVQAIIKPGLNMPKGFVSEARVAPYVHDRHRPDHGVFACCWRCAMIGADKTIRWSTAAAVIGVAGVAAVVSYEHAYALVHAHGEMGWTARLIPLTVDGLIWASSMVMLDSARRGVRVPSLARWLLGLGIAATLAANVAHGLSHGLIGSGVAAWPAVALVGSYELLMMIIRGSQQPAGGMSHETEEASADVPGALQAQAAEEFADDVAGGRMPSIRTIRARLHVGQSRAQTVRVYLTTLADGAG